MSIDWVEDEQSALSSAWHLQRTGNFVAALDLAQDSLRRWPHSQALEYLWILALASCGSTQAALDALRASSLSLNIDEDCLALEARLLKDLAFSGRADSATQLIEAAAAYERVAERTGGTYSRQNAALLWMLAGDHERAIMLAAAVAKQLTLSDVPKDEESAYFYWATLAEAALVLGDHAAFGRALAGANPLCRPNSWARSRTLLQMQRIAGVRPEYAALIEQWYRPPVGLVLIADWMPARLGNAVSLEAADMPALAYCFGRAPASDWHELAALGVQLHAIYPDTPLDEPTALPASLRPERDASGHLDTHTWSSLFLDETDDQQRVCAQTALGLSLGQADQLRAPWVILARSQSRWCMYKDADRTALRSAFDRLDMSQEQRPKYAFLFADAVSYSSLNAAETRRYWTSLLPQTAAAVLKRHAADIVVRKTWGDSVHAVFRSASAAASAALEIQAATARLTEELGRGRRLIFRMALHYGPADQGMDPVEETQSVFGPQLSFAARIEPVAPPGGIFVTEPFAARLSLEGAQNVHCSYVGTTSLAKSYGRVRLLRLA
ncbi:MAG TPA: adenylate/guanylate cyclase domain-containing protein [Steroidobacteraceae bacterium]